MIAGPDGSAICNECVIICMDVLVSEVEDLNDNIIQIKEEPKPDFVNMTCSCGGELRHYQLCCNPPKDVYQCYTCGTKHNRHEYEKVVNTGLL